MMSPNYSKETFENTNLTLELSQTTVLRCLVLSPCVRESDFLRLERNIVNTTITDFLPLFLPPNSTSFGKFSAESISYTATASFTET